LRESDPVHEVSVVLGVLNTDVVAMAFTVEGDQRDLRGLDLRNRVERRRSLTDAERNEKQAPAGLGMDTEGSVTFGVQDGIEGGAEVGIALEVLVWGSALWVAAMMTAS
jgi:hypothetical protein